MGIKVVYSSKTGFTEKYAGWIAEELGCGTQVYKDFMKADIDADDLVIFGSRIHAGKIEYLDKVKARFGKQPGQKLVVFATGATPVAHQDAVDKFWTDNLSESELEAIPHFYMQSGLDYGKMGTFDRMAMKAVAKLLSGKKEMSEEEASFANAIQESYDSSSKDYIAPLVEYVQQRQT